MLSKTYFNLPRNVNYQQASYSYDNASVRYSVGG
jgi:hypothetical protein